MNDICLAARLEITPNAFGERQAGKGQRSDDEPCDGVNSQSGRRFTPADAF